MLHLHVLDVPPETLGCCGGVISCDCLNVTQQCAALGYNPLSVTQKAAVHADSRSHVSDGACEIHHHSFSPRLLHIS